MLSGHVSVFVLHSLTSFQVLFVYERFDTFLKGTKNTTDEPSLSDSPKQTNGDNPQHFTTDDGFCIATLRDWTIQF